MSDFPFVGVLVGSSPPAASSLFVLGPRLCLAGEMFIETRRRQADTDSESRLHGLQTTYSLHTRRLIRFEVGTTFSNLSMPMYFCHDASASFGGFLEDKQRVSEFTSLFLQLEYQLKSSVPQR